MPDPIFNLRLPYHILDDILTLVGDDGLCAMCAARPDLIVDLYQYGAQKGIWLDRPPILRTASSVVTYYNNHPNQLSMGEWGTWSVPYPAHDQPIWLAERLIAYDAIASLQMLSRAGLFTVRSYTHTGWTALGFALAHRAERVANYFLSFYSPQELLHDRARIGLGAPSYWTLAVEGKEELLSCFVQMWACVSIASNPTPALSRDDICNLCTYISGGLAQSLLQQGLNVALMPADPMTRDISWHSAMSNRNLDFLDFLSVHARHLINDQTSGQSTPLYMASMLEESPEITARLISYGADITAPTRSGKSVLHHLVYQRRTKGKCFRTIFPHLRNLDLGAGTPVGTLLHQAIRGVETAIARTPPNSTIAENSRRRQRLLNAAAHECSRIRKGNQWGKPDIAQIDSQGLTPLQLAQNLGYHQLTYTLETRAHEAQLPSRRPHHRYHFR
ncbi:hypothetical protein P175DRAFT_0520819 [Aspergillus ochraceoroseus IBT 24754]|uniref:Uncharacterized protein n=1 Tax=Aspergillus ochraceoroseus IBT 24754 TaxID=1392256 RepID=A0A2T5M8X6_9EURO|nr:uncharacterized protein P175DRAFT_0520819 [Aspergillus ochraceoroseus IBT 24754]PTU24993.1 hypothetical protein P175DRAFT_0520819 [Aspergillus ochraceoroseus IBT 24754]